jgi:phosphatidylinositol-3-phosphatase
MKKITLLAFSIMLSSYALYAQVPIKAAHVIFILEENYAQAEIIGSPYAPTITAVSKMPTTVNFTQAFAITHPSEPNYLDLFSGSDQGVTSDESGPDANAPFNDCNLASSLIQNGYSFIGYAEDQPTVGWIAGDDNNYYTKHSPWINWIGYNTNADTIPEASDVPFSYVSGLYTSGPVFPDSTNYSSLPTVAWVIPNIVNDMHNPSTPSTAISVGDAWFKTNMMPLIRWANNPANKTIVITIWDEDDDEASGVNYHNNIPMLLTGGMINGRSSDSATTLTHYDVLKTIEDMYGLSLCGSSASGVDFPVSVWNTTAGINTVKGIADGINTWPVPAKNELNVNITASVPDNAVISMFDMNGKTVETFTSQLKAGDNMTTINTSGFANGAYFLTVIGDNIRLSKKIVVQN